MTFARSDQQVLNPGIFLRADTSCTWLAGNATIWRANPHCVTTSQCLASLLAHMVNAIDCSQQCAALADASPLVRSRRPNKPCLLMSCCQRGDLGISCFDFVDGDVRPNVSVDQAPVRHHVYSVTGRMRLNCADFQSLRTRRA